MDLSLCQTWPIIPSFEKWAPTFCNPIIFPTDDRSSAGIFKLIFSKISQINSLEWLFFILFSLGFHWDEVAAESWSCLAEVYPCHVQLGYFNFLRCIVIRHISHTVSFEPKTRVVKLWKLLIRILGRHYIFALKSETWLSLRKLYYSFLGHFWTFMALGACLRNHFSSFLFDFHLSAVKKFDCFLCVEHDAICSGLWLHDGLIYKKLSRRFFKFIIMILAPMHISICIETIHQVLVATNLHSKSLCGLASVLAVVIIHC